MPVSQLETKAAALVKLLLKIVDFGMSHLDHLQVFKEKVLSCHLRFELFKEAKADVYFEEVLS